MNNSSGIKYDDAIELLKSLISIPSFSREEAGTADRIQQWLLHQGVEAERHLNNIWAKNSHFKPELPTILLNSHHDTVKPNNGYNRTHLKPIENR